MTEVLKICAWVATILGGVNIVIQFLRFIIRRNREISYHVLYVAIVICVSGVYMLVSSGTSKRMDAIYECAVKPYVRIVSNDIRVLRHKHGITDSSVLRTSMKSQYPTGIVNECRKLQDLGEYIELTPDSYYELGLLEYSQRNYNVAREYGEMAITINPHFLESYLLVSASYRCMDNLPLASYYYYMYERKKKLQEGDIKVTVSK